MPLVGPTDGRERAGAARSLGARVGSLFPRCANPHCATGWMRLWRGRRTPGFEGGWACSPECMRALVAAAVRREMDGGAVPSPHTHRVPMGLLLVEQGRITPDQLHAALAGQRQAAESRGGNLRLGEWLLRSGVLQESALTRALSAQWNCPVLSLAGARPAEMVSAMPQFFSEAFDALPVRTRGSRLVYLAFSGRVDRTLSYAVERMTGLRVAAGIAPASEFAAAQQQFLAAAAPPVRFLEAPSSWVLVRALTKVMEAARPVEARLARVHDYFWLRIWRRAADPGLPPAGVVEDLVATLGAPAAPGRRNPGWRDSTHRR